MVKEASQNKAEISVKWRVEADVIDGEDWGKGNVKREPAKGYRQQRCMQSLGIKWCFETAAQHGAQAVK